MDKKRAFLFWIRSYDIFCGICIKHLNKRKVVTTIILL